MKLDKIKFARLIGMITSIAGRTLDSEEIEAFDYVCDVEVPIARVSETDVCELLKQINSTDGFIPAIKAYRSLTGAGLKESKEAIERYRSIPNFPKKEPATLGDILNQAVNGK